MDYKGIVGSVTVNGADLTRPASTNTPSLLHRQKCGASSFSRAAARARAAAHDNDLAATVNML